jgi:hypothetical protein
MHAYTYTVAMHSLFVLVDLLYVHGFTSSYYSCERKHTKEKTEEPSLRFVYSSVLLTPLWRRSRTISYVSFPKFKQRFTREIVAVLAPVSNSIL